jgi:cytochrome P450
MSAPPRYAQLANQYVLETSKKVSSAPFTLIARLQSKGADLPELAMPAECMDHLAAGIDTTGDGLCFLMHELSLPRSQYAQKRLQHELFDNPDIPFDQLPYLDAIVKEGLRCFPPIPMSFPRYVPAEGRTISGFWVPGGTIVSAQPYTLHKNEGVFPRPLDFVPERWLSEKGASEREEMYFAFSKGSRGCLGRK